MALSPDPVTPGKPVRIEMIGQEAVGDFQVNVFDLAGRAFGLYTALSSGKRATAEFSLPEAGWYLVRVKGNEGWQSEFRIVCVATR